MTKAAVHRPGAPPGRLKLTYDDYAAISDDRRYELLDGALIMVPAPETPHQDFSMSLAGILDRYVRRKQLGKVLCAPTDVVLSLHTTLQPDLLFIAKEREHLITKANIQGAPDWVAEIVSPSSRDLDYGRKMSLYARHGVREYWVLDPEARGIESYVLDGKTYRLAQRAVNKGRVVSVAIEGFSVTLAQVLPTPR